MIRIIICLGCFFALASKAEVVEEFHAHGPMDFHNLAMNSFMEMRKIDPKENLSHDGAFLQKATAHAIRRGVRKSDEDLSITAKTLSGATVESIGDSSILLQLPGPEGQDAYLSAAVTAQGSAGYHLVRPEESRARAVAFNEEIGLGAISKTGALPMGSDGQWLSLADEKIKKDSSLDYQSLLWEIGSEVAEAQQIARGGLNASFEEELLESMNTWFIQGGGKLGLVKPNFNNQTGYELLAEEGIHEEDTVLSMPMKLIMCRQTARNVVIPNRGKYLGDELTKTFDKNEIWGMTIFLLHEYYKEINGNGSKWGPFIRTLRMRYLSTKTVQSLKGTIASYLSNQWLKSSHDFMWWSVGIDGPCSPTTGICKVKPKEKAGDTRFNIHQIRWAYWTVKQNAVKIKQIATGLKFIALIPYYNMVGKKFHGGGGITFDLDGTVSLRVGEDFSEGNAISVHPGNFSDSEYYLRYLSVPHIPNEFTEIKLKLPGAIPKGSKFHYCMKGSEKEQNRDDCKASFKSDSMFWKSKVLTEWRQVMNLPPRMQELRMWATRLHLYGGQEEMNLISQANQLIAGLPLPVDQMPAEEQLMLLGIARDNDEAALIASGPQGDRPPPQLYSAPDPTEDYEAQRGMENLALLAVQAQNVISSGNTVLNATQVVLNETKNFFLHGVLPKAGLDTLDMFLLKKIGMLSHCGFEDDMKIVYGNITEELMCAMRVHLMNESEMHVFCPKDARVFEENCMNVEFLNFTAISDTNERAVIGALRGSIDGLLGSYPSTVSEDLDLMKQYETGGFSGENDEMGPISYAAVKLRYREKSILFSALDYLLVHENKVTNGSISFQLALKAQERIEADLRSEIHKKFMESIRLRAAEPPELAFVEVDLGDNMPKANLTLQEGFDIRQTVMDFCKQHGVKANFVETLEKALRARVKNPPALHLMLGVIIPSTGDRVIFGIPEGTGVNYTVETGVFCTRNDPSAKDAIDSTWCKALLNRVHDRLQLNVTSNTVITTYFSRRILQVVPIDAPDSRKLQLVVREGEQHDLYQYVSDFMEYYRMPKESALMLANEVNKRLPNVALQIPVGITSKRQVAIRFSMNDNITEVVNAFVNFYELDNAMKVEILKRARNGMAPGTFLV